MPPSSPSLVELVARTGHDALLDLPWHLPLREWRDPRLVDIARGVSRHTVRMVDVEGVVYAVKETAEHTALAEYELLRELGERRLPVVEPVGVARKRTDVDGNPLDAMLITRHLSFSLPYRYLFMGRSVAGLRNQLVDALALLLVKLHLEGFIWGDCSLSNTLFRRDAGELTAYLVDAETGKIHPSRPSQGQRSYDLDQAMENIGGELMDLHEARPLPEGVDPLEVGEDLRRRYDRLWDLLTREEVIPANDRHRIAQRTRKLEELGFEVAELVLRPEGDGQRVRVIPRVVEPGHYERVLEQLTGISADAHQARRLLGDMAETRAEWEHEAGRTLPQALTAYRWLTEIYEPTIAAIPSELRDRLPPPEMYHQIMEHRWYESEREGRDVGPEQAMRSYVDSVLRPAAPEQALMPDDDGNDPTGIIMLPD
jgi:Domain of unknown function (DUF4032)/Lipopolysaccharide kinase (Kdo/WaaP) family